MSHDSKEPMPNDEQSTPQDLQKYARNILFEFQKANELEKQKNAEITEFSKTLEIQLLQTIVALEKEQAAGNLLRKEQAITEGRLQELRELREKETQDMGRRLATKDQACIELEDALQEERQILDQLQAKHDDLQKEAGEQAKKQINLETAQENLKEALDLEKMQVAALKIEHSKAQKEWERLTAEQKQECETLTAKLNEITETAKTKVETLQGNLSELEKTKEALEAERSRQATENELIRNKKHELEQELERLKEDWLKKGNENKASIATYEAKQSELERLLAQEGASFRQIKDEHEEALRKAKEEEVKWEALNAEQKQKLSASLKTQQSLDVALLAEMTRFQGLEKESRAARISFETLLESLREEIKQLETKLAKQIERQVETDTKNLKLKEGLIAQEIENQVKQADIKQTLEQEKTRLVEIESSYNQARQEWKEKSKDWEERSREQKQEYEVLNTRFVEATQTSQAKIGSLETQLESIERTRETLEETKATLENEREKQDQVIQSAANQQQQLEQEIEALKKTQRDQRTEREEKQFDLELSLEQEKIKLAEAESEHKRAQQGWKEKNQNLEGLVAEQKKEQEAAAARLNEATEKVKEKSEALQESLSELGKAKDLLEDERSKQEAAIESAHNKQSDLEKEIEKLKEGLITQEIENQVKQADLERALGQERTKLAQSESAYSREQQERKEENKAWEALRTEQKREHETLTAKLNESAGTAKVKIETLQSKLGELEKTKEALEVEQSRQAAENELIRNKKYELGQEIEKLKEEWLNQEIESEAKQAELEKILTQEKTKLAEVELAYSEAEQGWKAKNKDWEDFSADQKQEYAALTAKHNELAQESQAKIESLEVSLCALGKTKELLETERQKQDNAIQAARAKQNELEQEAGIQKKERLRKDLENEAKFTEYEEKISRHESRQSELERVIAQERASFVELKNEYIKAQNKWKEEGRTREEVDAEQEQKYEALAAKLTEADKASQQKIEKLEANLCSLEKAKEGLEAERTRRVVESELMQSRLSETEQEIKRQKEELLRQETETKAKAVEHGTKQAELLSALQSEKANFLEAEKGYARAQSEWRTERQRWEEMQAEKKNEHEALVKRLSEADQIAQQKIGDLNRDLMLLEKTKVSLEGAYQLQEEAFQIAAAKQKELERLLQVEKESANKRIKTAEDEHAKAVKAHHFNFERKEKELEDHIQQLKDEMENMAPKALEQKIIENEKSLKEQVTARKVLEVELEEQKQELVWITEELEKEKKGEGLRLGQVNKQIVDFQVREKEAQKNLDEQKKEIRVLRENYSALEEVKNKIFEALKVEKKKQEIAEAVLRAEQLTVAGASEAIDLEKKKTAAEVVRAQKLMDDAQEREKKSQEAIAAQKKENLQLQNNYVALEAVKERISKTLLDERESWMATKKSHDETQEKLIEAKQKIASIQHELDDSRQNLLKREADAAQWKRQSFSNSNPLNNKQDEKAALKDKEELARAAKNEVLRSLELEDKLARMKEKVDLQTAGNQGKVARDEPKQNLSSKEQIQRLEYILGLEDKKKS